MRVVHKFEIKGTGFSLIELNKWDIILDAMVIEEKLFIWVERHPDTHEETIERIFFLVNTGEEWDSQQENRNGWDQFNIYNHIRTVRFANGIVQHLFEAKELRKAK
jgi:hypothetical protein